MKGRRGGKTAGCRGDSRWGAAPGPGIFRGMAPVFDRKSRGLRQFLKPEARCWIEAPSVWLSLVGLRPRRA